MPNRARACWTPRASRPLPMSRPPGKASMRARRSPDASAISASTPSASSSRSGSPRPASPTAGGIHLLSHIARDHPTITKAWADTGYRTKAIENGAILGIDVEVTPRDPGQKGFKVIPRRWVVERTFGWLMNHRRLARDYETHSHRSEAMIRIAMIDLMSRRLTRESTPNWKDS